MMIALSAALAANANVRRTRLANPRRKTDIWWFPGRSPPLHGVPPRGRGQVILVTPLPGRLDTTRQLIQPPAGAEKHALAGERRNLSGGRKPMLTRRRLLQGTAAATAGIAIG